MITEKDRCNIIRICKGHYKEKDDYVSISSALTMYHNIICSGSLDLYGDNEIEIINFLLDSFDMNEIPFSFLLEKSPMENFDRSMTYEEKLLCRMINGIDMCNNFSKTYEKEFSFEDFLEEEGWYESRM